MLLTSPPALPRLARGVAALIAVSSAWAAIMAASAETTARIVLLLPPALRDAALALVVIGGIGLTAYLLARLTVARRGAEDRNAANDNAPRLPATFEWSTIESPLETPAALRR